MGEGTGSPILAVLLLCVAASLVLAATGAWLHRRGRLTSRRAALGWAVLTVVPLFGAGLAMMTRHTVDLATGETQPGVNAPPPTR